MNKYDVPQSVLESLIFRIEVLRCQLIPEFIVLGQFDPCDCIGRPCLVLDRSRRHIYLQAMVVSVSASVGYHLPLLTYVVVIFDSRDRFNALNLTTAKIIKKVLS